MVQYYHSLSVVNTACHQPWTCSHISSRPVRGWYNPIGMFFFLIIIEYIHGSILSQLTVTSFYNTFITRHGAQGSQNWILHFIHIRWNVQIYSIWGQRTSSTKPMHLPWKTWSLLFKRLCHTVFYRLYWNVQDVFSSPSFVSLISFFIPVTWSHW